MTPQQEATLERLRGEQVAFPPLFEADGGAVVAVLVLSWAMEPGKVWSAQNYVPMTLELQAVRIEPDGRETILADATMGRVR